MEVACAPIDKAGPRHVSMRQGGAALTWPLRHAGVSITTTVGKDSTVTTVAECDQIRHELHQDVRGVVENAEEVKVRLSCCCTVLRAVPGSCCPPPAN